MDATIFYQYPHDNVASALRKVLATCGIHCDLRRLTSNLQAVMARLQSEALLFLLPSYWEIQSSHILPLFRLVTGPGSTPILEADGAPGAGDGMAVPSQEHRPRKCMAISVGTDPLFRPCLGLNLPEILEVLSGKSPQLEVRATRLDAKAQLDVVGRVTTVVRHLGDPNLWAEYLSILINFRGSDSFENVQQIIRASLAAANDKAAITRIAELLDKTTRESIVTYFFPSETCL